MAYTREEFIKKMTPLVIADARKTKILASLTMAQAILESGNGNSGLTTQANNLFGIKAGSSYPKYVTMKTKEWDGTKYITIDARFRAYDSWEESIADHSNLFLTLKLSTGVNGLRYGNLIGETDYKKACQYVREDGYATAPTYTTTLIALIEQYKLYELDRQVLNSNNQGGTEMTSDEFDALLEEVLNKRARKDGSSWSAEQRQWAVESGIIAGTTGDPNDPGYMWKGLLTREQAAVVLHRFYKTLQE